MGIQAQNLPEKTTSASLNDKVILIDSEDSNKMKVIDADKFR